MLNIALRDSHLVQTGLCHTMRSLLLPVLHHISTWTGDKDMTLSPSNRAAQDE